MNRILALVLVTAVLIGVAVWIDKHPPAPPSSPA
jgi:hypothetical protein